MGLLACVILLLARLQNSLCSGVCRVYLVLHGVWYWDLWSWGWCMGPGSGVVWVVGSWEWLGDRVRAGRVLVGHGVGRVSGWGLVFRL